MHFLFQRGAVSASMDCISEGLPRPFPQDLCFEEARHCGRGLVQEITYFDWYHWDKTDQQKKLRDSGFTEDFVSSVCEFMAVFWVGGDSRTSNWKKETIAIDIHPAIERMTAVLVEWLFKPLRALETINFCFGWDTSASCIGLTLSMWYPISCSYPSIFWAPFLSGSLLHFWHFIP